MKPLRLTRQSAPVQAMYLADGSDLADVYEWLTECGFEVELHPSHGLLIYADGPIAVDYGRYVTVDRAGRVQVWDANELLAEHEVAS